MIPSGYLHSATLTMKDTAYCPDAFNYQRRSSRPVQVGSIGIGGEHPIRVQSMTTTNTLDVDATVAQSIPVSYTNLTLPTILLV